ncbi:vegetative cell wall protein gp1-like [Herrania umbratica]|uniref:Vegetative cell wall protein gp1-like n=1 Tax=Herrania umbratica TaxID=108875 RepID=A0A6J1AB77_9ROSI|nr:vegetative cell wall protein gp1-like [Herrania umbratica]
MCRTLSGAPRKIDAFYRIPSGFSFAVMMFSVPLTYCLRPSVRSTRPPIPAPSQAPSAPAGHVCLRAAPTLRLSPDAAPRFQRHCPSLLAFATRRYSRECVRRPRPRMACLQGQANGYMRPAREPRVDPAPYHRPDSARTPLGPPSSGAHSARVRSPADSAGRVWMLIMRCIRPIFGPANPAPRAARQSANSPTPPLTRGVPPPPAQVSARPRTTRPHPPTRTNIRPIFYHSPQHTAYPLRSALPCSQKPPPRQHFASSRASRTRPRSPAPNTQRTRAPAWPPLNARHPRVRDHATAARPCRPAPSSPEPRAHLHRFVLT